MVGHVHIAGLDVAIFLQDRFTVCLYLDTSPKKQRMYPVGIAAHVFVGWFDVIEKIVKILEKEQKRSHVLFG